MKCKKHPTYKAIREPRCGCEICWKMWNVKKLNNSTNVKTKTELTERKTNGTN